VTYDAAFYNTIRPGTQTSAAAVIPLVLDRVGPVRTVVDVGCGEGWWAAAFDNAGCEVIGVDGPYVAHAQVLGDRFIPADLTQPLPGHLAGRFDLAVCLEVAEHLPERRAASFVADLCGLADAVLFSAAIPHQSGAGHINLKWPTWWADLFAEHGFGFDGSIRWDIWTDVRIEPWYRQNLHLAVRGGPVSTVDVVHPILHGWGR
jgi:SAM-dependent methyltransferase